MHSNTKSRLRKFSKYISIFSFASLFSAKESQAIITLSKISGVPTKSVTEILDSLIGWVLGFGLMIAVTFLVWSGIVYVSSSGDAQKAENAKKTMKYAILGVLVIGISFAILRALDEIFDKV